MISSSPIAYSLVELLNFVVKDDSMPVDRRMKQKFLREFVGSFKGFQCGKGLGQKNSGYMDAELVDKAYYFISIGLAHSPPNTIIYEEVGISMPHNHALPHGNLDLLSLVQKQNASVVVALHCFLGGGKVATGKCSQVTATTVKTKYSYGSLPNDSRTASFF